MEQSNSAVPAAEAKSRRIFAWIAAAAAGNLVFLWATGAIVSATIIMGITSFTFGRHLHLLRE
ncbi:MAG TPA: hypothetical protein VEB21_15305 [Terriglobales bacterium]|nr:hypothetical protein [Terriglobales bacterium]